MKNPNMRLVGPIFLLVVIFASLFPFPEIGAQSGVEIYLPEMSCQAFPEMNVKLRATDQDGNVLAQGMTGERFSVLENGQPVSGFELVGTEQGPMFVVFSLDLGQFSNLDDYKKEVQDSLRVFANNYFRDEIDMVAILTHIKTDSGQRSVPVLPPTRSRAEFTAAIDSLSLHPGDQQLEGFLGIETAFETLLEMTAQKPERYSAVIVHFSRLVEKIRQSEVIAGATNLAAEIAPRHVKMYMLQTDTSGLAESVEGYKKLAALTGGQYLDYTTASRQTELTKFYDAILNNSLTYLGQFRSRLADTGLRTVEVLPSDASGSPAQDAQTCSITLQNPAVQIITPQGPTFSIERHIIPGSVEGNLVLDTPSTPVVAQLQLPWSDGFPRQIVQADLLINGATEQSITPDADQTRYEFTLDLSRIVAAQTLDAQVRVQDELGREGVSASVSLNIIIEDVGTPIVVITPIPTPHPCEESSTSLACLQKRAEGSLVWIGLIGFFIVSVLLILTRRQLSSIASAGVQVVRKAGAEIRKTLLGGRARTQDVLAYMDVLVASPDRKGGKISIYNARTTLGRDPNITDVQLYDADEDCSVSGQHCTILYDRGGFLITDDNSTNGTFVNGKRLLSNEPTELSGGDEIILGDIFRKGAKLRFEINQTETGNPTQIEREADVKVTYPDFDDEDDFRRETGHTPTPSPEPAPNQSEEQRRYRITEPGFRDFDEKDTFSQEVSRSTPKASPVEPDGRRRKKGKDQSWKDQLG